LSGCFVSGSLSRTVDQAPISKNAFTIQLNDSDGKQYVVKGALNSGTAASGTLQTRGNSNTCGPYDATVNWTANKNVGSQGSGSPSSPPSGGPASDSEVVQAFFDALNAKNVDAAVAQADESVVYNIGSVSGGGAAGLKNYLKVQIAAGTTYQLSGVTEDIIGVNFKVKAGTTNFTGTAFVDDGKISILKMQ
jgi:hypothetical protein